MLCLFEFDFQLHYVFPYNAMVSCREPSVWSLPYRVCLIWIILFLWLIPHWNFRFRSHINPINEVCYTTARWSREASITDVFFYTLKFVGMNRMLGRRHAKGELFLIQYDIRAPPSLWITEIKFLAINMRLHANLLNLRYLKYTMLFARRTYKLDKYFPKLKKK